MTDAASLAQALLRDHRDSIDRLDAILVYTLPGARGAADRTSGTAFARSRS